MYSTSKAVVLHFLSVHLPGVAHLGKFAPPTSVAWGLISAEIYVS